MKNWAKNISESVRNAFRNSYLGWFWKDLVYEERKILIFHTSYGTYQWLNNSLNVPLT